ncbi:MAG: Rieske 2Fe-2S domain-containing protein [Cyanobacteria bacterium P01_A01_bin.17]
MEQVVVREQKKRQTTLTAPTTGLLASGLKDYWYAVEFSSKLQDATLIPFELFDQPWVLFRDRQGQVGCIQDECAHRACPLSLGQVVDGTVQCGYHGWQYDANGSCTHMPSCQHIQVGIKSLPCQEQNGMIWVWPGSAQPTELSEHIYQLPEGFQLHAEVAMELPVEHGLLLENLLDLAHAPFTHTGTFAKGWSVPDLVRFMTPQTPLTGHWDPYPIEMSFEPPCYVISTIGLRGKTCGRHLHQLHCCLPAGQGKTRLLYQLSLDFYGWARFLPGKDRFWRSMAQRVIDEDLRLVVGQQNRLAAGADVWRTPVGYDKLGISYRRWRNQIEQNSPDWHER